MKLYYYKDWRGFRNFGDDLNAWVWPKLLPGFFDEDEACIFIGFGTLLNEHIEEKVPRLAQKIVFTTGVGYGQRLPNLDSSWHIVAVRGPLSAERLKVDDERAVTDGAVLVRQLYSPPKGERTGTAFMPHISQALGGGRAWRQICDQLGLRYIDPQWEIEVVLQALAASQLVLTQALHGAIVADALRVPWVPLHSHGVLDFKWRDWAASMRLSYKPFPIPSLWDSAGQAAALRSLRAATSRHIKMRLARHRLQRILRSGVSFLSNDSLLERKLEIINRKIDFVKEKTW